MSYMAFYHLTENLAMNGESWPEYPIEKYPAIRLNYHRMKRVMKQVKLPFEVVSEIREIDKPMVWAVLAEPWCMDAANLLPIMHSMAMTNPNIELRIYLRDQHPGFMDRYLTDGTRSIPKLIAYDQHMHELGTWGPRPQTLIDHIAKLKSEEGLSGEPLKVQIQVWYNRNKGVSFIHEFSDYLRHWTSMPVALIA